MGSYETGFTRILTELTEIVCKLYIEDRLIEDIDQVPIRLKPLNMKKGTTSRCCVYRDRALLKYRIMALLGHSIEDETDETKPLSEYAREALGRIPGEICEPVITVLNQACNHCTLQHYMVTDACQCCLARPCAVNCPKNAISHVEGKAKINADKCVRCGKCMKVCPFNAIINIPIPCVEQCPVGAIVMLPDGSKKFDFDKCIFCGNCQRSCPFGAVMPKSQLIDVLNSMRSGARVFALPAPAIAAHFSTDIGRICAGLKKFGFDDVIEVAVGADEVAQSEAKEFSERIETKPGFMTTSCCPAYINCVRKHIPELEDAVSHTPTPLHCTSRFAKEIDPDCITVFIGPCVAKRMETLRDPYTDFALTIAEVVALFKAKNIDPAQLEPYKSQFVAYKEGRGFAVSGGVTNAVKSFATKAGIEVKPLLIDGLNPKTVLQLKAFVKKPTANLVEVMACAGGCIAGPGTLFSTPAAAARLKMAVNSSEAHPNGSMIIPETKNPVKKPDHIEKTISDSSITITKSDSFQVVLDTQNVDLGPDIGCSPLLPEN